VNWSSARRHLDKSAQGRVHGVAPSFQEIRSLTIDDGRFINERDVAEARNVAVLGCETKRRLFGGRRAGGEVITIQGRRSSSWARCRRKSSTTCTTAPTTRW